MENFKQQEQPKSSEEKKPQNRILEIADNGWLDNQIAQASKIGVEKYGAGKRIEILKTKKLIFESFIIESLKEEFDQDSEKDDALSSSEFRTYINRVRKERLVKMLEVKKMQSEEALEDFKSGSEEWTYAVNYIDAVDELIGELEK